MGFPHDGSVPRYLGEDEWDVLAGQVGRHFELFILNAWGQMGIQVIKSRENSQLSLQVMCIDICL